MGDATAPDLIDRLVDGSGSGLFSGPGRLFWWGIWLVFLVNPIQAVVRYDTPTALAGWGGLAAFTALYLLAGWHALGLHGGPVPGDLRPYAAFMAVSLLLIVAFGGPWTELVIYMGVATGATLPIPRAIAVLAGLACLEAALLATGRLGPGDAVFGTFMTLALGASMMLLRRTILLIRELRAARQDVARLAVADERVRFSRDLHDVLGHNLSVIALQAQVARRLMGRDPAAAEAALSSLEGVAHESLDAVREMVAGYRQLSLGEELDGAREVLEAAGIRLEVRWNAGALATPGSGLLAWVVREGVTNVIRHSRARVCRIAIETTGDAVSLELSDDGVGEGASTVDAGADDARGGGNGLRGLRERAAALGGTIDAGPGPDGGFRLLVRLPAAAA